MHQESESVSIPRPEIEEGRQHVPKYRFVRIAHDGERYLPHRYRDGFYRVANPALKSAKHHAANQIAISQEEISTFLKRGFLLRMRGESSGQVNLIAAAEIEELE
jgi:hypothetical protein